VIAAFSFRAWSPLSPAVVLVVLIALSLVAALIDRASRHRRRKMLRTLAIQWQMTYSASDQLRVAEKVGTKLPVPGAADVHVTDVIYGAQGDNYRYWFTAVYTTGAVRAKRRQARVGTFSEPRDKRRSSDASSAVTFAPEDLTLIEQYVKLGPQSAPILAAVTPA
jgi:hypothetical protein